MIFIFLHDDNKNKNKILRLNPNKNPTCKPTHNYQLFVEQVSNYEITSEPTELIGQITHFPTVLPKNVTQNNSCICNIERNNDINNNLLIGVLVISTFTMIGVFFLIYYKYYSMKNKKNKKNITYISIDDIDFGIRGI